MACPTGIEPVTPSLEGWCSIRLSYGHHSNRISPQISMNWSGWRDLNSRHPGPKPGALPGYATPRKGDNIPAHQEKVNFTSLQKKLSKGFPQISMPGKQLCPQRREISSAFQFVPLDHRVGRMIMDGFKVFRLHYIGFYAGVTIQYRCRITYHVFDKFGVVVGLFSHMLFV